MGWYNKVIISKFYGLDSKCDTFIDNNLFLTIFRQNMWCKLYKKEKTNTKTNTQLKPSSQTKQTDNIMVWD